MKNALIITLTLAFLVLAPTATVLFSKLNW